MLYLIQLHCTKLYRTTQWCWPLAAGGNDNIINVLHVVATRIYMAARVHGCLRLHGNLAKTGMCGLYCAWMSWGATGLLLQLPHSVITCMRWCSAVQILKCPFCCFVTYSHWYTHTNTLIHACALDFPSKHAGIYTSRTHRHAHARAHTNWTYTHQCGFGCNFYTYC